MNVAYSCVSVFMLIDSDTIWTKSAIASPFYPTLGQHLI